MNLIARYKAWRKRRYWQAQQFERLRNTIMTDWRWLAHDPVASELTERYMRMLREDWYTVPHEDTPQFRRRIGLEPQYSATPTLPLMAAIKGDDK